MQLQEVSVSLIMSVGMEHSDFHQIDVREILYLEFLVKLLHVFCSDENCTKVPTFDIKTYKFS